MSTRANFVIKTSETSGKRSIPQKKTTNFSKYSNSPVDRILFLQKTVGNQAVQRLIKSGALQTKLTVGKPNDIYEQEADRVAEQVMRMPDLSKAQSNRVSKDDKDPSIQRVCAECEEELQMQPVVEEEEEETLQTKEATGESPGVTPSAESQINSMRGGGQPLPESVRSFFEPRFGHDFSKVRVHTDQTATAAAKAVNARAFTLGKNIVFGAGRYDPQTQDGKRLLAHELTHTIQQEAAAPTNAKAPDDERGYDNSSILRKNVRSAQTSVQRQAEDLRATRFSGNQILERAFDNRTTVSQRNNRRGTHVRLIQESLLAQGYALPVHGADGIFGPETEAAVRAFQVDAGAVLLDGIVGPETMQLLDMLDPGGTTGVGAPAGGAPPPATAAVFAEAPTETFAGYDASTTPNWLVVPVNERRRANVAVTPAAARPTFVSDTPGVATVAPSRTGIVVTSVAHGTANIQAREGAVVLDTLRVTVKNQIDRSVAFHYVCDSRPAAAGGPHCSNGTPSADEMRSLLNRVWHRQANVRFTGGASHNIVVPGDMGAYVNDDGFGGDEMGVVTAAAPAPADYNVFRVWEVRLSHGAVNNALNNANNTLIGDAPCADGWGLPHECGHFLGLGHGSGFIMTPCGGRVDQRVSKAMVDAVNP